MNLIIQMAKLSFRLRPNQDVTKRYQSAKVQTQIIRTNSERQMICVNINSLECLNKKYK